MSDENIQHETLHCYKFKPIDMDDNQIIIDDSCLVGGLTQHSQQESPHELQMVGAGMIFREVPDNNTTENGLLVRRANPVGSYTAAAEDDLESSCRVISPYPFSHTSQEEIEDREQLAGAFDWALQSDDTPQPGACEPRIFEMDYARFFEMDCMDVDGSPDEDSDDFSIASSVSIDLCLENTDPTTFWEVGMTSMKNDAQQRSKSPSQVSLSS